MNIRYTTLVGSLILIGLLPCALLRAGEVDVVDVTVECYPQCAFHVTLKHTDEGWKHYANRWDVVTPDGKVLGTRVLYHPHVEEQPFTRSLEDVEIPPGVTEVIIRANDSVHGHGGKEKRVSIPAR